MGEAAMCAPWVPRPSWGQAAAGAAVVAAASCCHHPSSCQGRPCLRRCDTLEYTPESQTKIGAMLYASPSSVQFTAWLIRPVVPMMAYSSVQPRLQPPLL